MKIPYPHREFIASFKTPVECPGCKSSQVEIHGVLQLDHSETWSSGKKIEDYTDTGAPFDFDVRRIDCDQCQKSYFVDEYLTEEQDSRQMSLPFEGKYGPN